MNNTVIVLTINDLKDSVCGDITKYDDMDYWMTAMAQGLAIAVAGGPPCGSWGPARHRDDERRGRRHRPLRARSRP
eukprot:2653747-Pyramimonas_sp.AAC.1